MAADASPSPYLLSGAFSANTEEEQRVHPHRVGTVLASHERRKRNGTNERPSLAERQSAELSETPENQKTLNGRLTPEDFGLVARASAGEDARTS